MLIRSLWFQVLVASVSTVRAELRLDNAFVLIEGHPKFRIEGWATRPY
jgi:hypothetical protein